MSGQQSASGPTQPVAAVVVNYNTRLLLRDCVSSLLREEPATLVVVDNASDDGSAELIAAEFPQAVLQANQDNIGYGAAANQGVARTSEPYVLLLNADTRVAPGALRAVADYFERHPRVGIIGPRIVGLDGHVQSTCFPFPTPWNQFLDMSNARRLIARIPVLREHYLPTWSHNAARTVPWVLGAALGIRREAFDAISGFDEGYFMYSEEIDLCLRMHRQGWQVAFVPEAEVMHVGAASTSQNRSHMALRAHAATLRFYELHYSRLARWQLRALMVLAMGAKAARDTARLQWTQGTAQRSRLIEDRRTWLSILTDVGLRPEGR